MCNRIQNIGHNQRCITQSGQFRDPSRTRVDGLGVALTRAAWMLLGFALARTPPSPESRTQRNTCAPYETPKCAVVGRRISPSFRFR